MSPIQQACLCWQTYSWLLFGSCLNACLIPGLALGIPLVFSLASWGGGASISNALCFAQKEKIQCNPEPDSVTCHHLQTLSWEEGHKVRSFLFWDHRDKREDMTISIKILPDFIKIVVIKNFCKLSSDLRMYMPLSKRNKRKHSMTFNN